MIERHSHWLQENKTEGIAIRSHTETAPHSTHSLTHQVVSATLNNPLDAFQTWPLTFPCVPSSLPECRGLWIMSRPDHKVISLLVLIRTPNGDSEGTLIRKSTSTLGTGIRRLP